MFIRSIVHSLNRRIVGVRRFTSLINSSSSSIVASSAPFINTSAVRFTSTRTSNERASQRQQQQQHRSNMSVDIVIDPFCLRQFLPPTSGQIHIPCTAEEMVKRVNEASSLYADGYAPFCKHLFIRNWMDTVTTAAMPITPDNQHLITSTYSARTEKELPVLIRYFPKDKVVAPKAEWLDIILYSREQIEKENAAMASVPSTGTNPTSALNVPSCYTSASTDARWTWGIVSIKPQSVDFEQPMSPMTMMRNALGVDEGGSGIPLDREQYKKSVDFWQVNAAIS